MFWRQPSVLFIAVGLDATCNLAAIASLLPLTPALLSVKCVIRCSYGLISFAPHGSGYVHHDTSAPASTAAPSNGTFMTADDTLAPTQPPTQLPTQLPTLPPTAPQTHDDSLVRMHSCKHHACTCAHTTGLQC